MKATYKQAVDSLFAPGGTLTEDYIELSEGRQIVAKVPVSQFTQYNTYNASGEIIKGYCHVLYARHNNHLVAYDSTSKKAKAWLVEEDYIYSYNFLKTKIKADGGIDGLMKTINRINSPDSPLNMYLAGTLKKVNKEFIRKEG